MKLFKTLPVLILLLAAAGASFAQKDPPEEPHSGPPDYLRASPAFAEIVLRKAILEAELEDLLVRYTEEFPKVVEKRFEISELDKSLDSLSKVPESESTKLSIALGRMLVQRAAYATELEMLTRRYNDAHPEVKRARRKFEVFDRAVKRIL
jgi:uncharacterized protein involved in exopolysaccharide biosynthesis